VWDGAIRTARGGATGGSRAGPAPEADETKRKTDTVFVGRLSYDTTEDSLKALGEEFGEVVSARIAKDKDTGASKGCVRACGSDGPWSA
jgi:RNA recognition motif-containing protein